MVLHTKLKFCIFPFFFFATSSINQSIYDVPPLVVEQEKDPSGKIPTWSDLLIISPTWQFSKSWVYCGEVTKRYSAHKHNPDPAENGSMHENGWIRILIVDIFR